MFMNITWNGNMLATTEIDEFAIVNIMRQKYLLTRLFLEKAQKLKGYRILRLCYKYAAHVLDFI